MVRGGGRPPELARFDLAAGGITARHPIDVAGPLTDIVISGEETPVIWVSDWAGTVVRLDPGCGRSRDQLSALDPTEGRLPLLTG